MIGMYFSLPKEEKKEQRERMGGYISVFNNHINNAGNRAKAVMEEFFPTYYSEIAKADAKGIMSIFGEEPSKATLIYVALVTAFVNGG